MRICGIYDEHSKKEMDKIKSTADWYAKDFTQFHNLIKGLI